MRFLLIIFPSFLYFLNIVLVGFYKKFLVNLATRQSKDALLNVLPLVNELPEIILTKHQHITLYNSFE